MQPLQPTLKEMTRHLHRGAELQNQQSGGQRAGTAAARCGLELHTWCGQGRSDAISPMYASPGDSGCTMGHVVGLELAERLALVEDT